MQQTATVAEILVDPRTARVYEFGWQSWTPTTAYSLGERSHRPSRVERQVSGYRPGVPKPAVGYQGDGLLAVQAHEAGPVHVIGVLDGGFEVPTIRAGVLGDGRLAVTADGPIEVVVDTGEGGINGALGRFGERYLDRVGSRPVLRDIPPVWASWYQYFTKFNQDDLTENLDAMDQLDLNVGVVRLDDAFQAGIGDWLELSGGFTSLEAAVGDVTERGRAAGLWIAPLLVGADSSLFSAHPDWVVRESTGAPVLALHNWEQDCYALDITHPAASDYLHRVLSTWRGYGTSYFMVDFMFAGALEGRRYQGDVTGIAAYRNALGLIRDAIGPTALLQGCGAPMFPSVGLVDSMRVGPDVNLTWAASGDDFSRPGLASALVSTVGRAFTHGRFWVNDPDCFMLRPGIERRQEWADSVARWSGARISSDRLTTLDRWGLAKSRELLIPSGTSPLEITGDVFPTNP